MDDLDTLEDIIPDTQPERLAAWNWNLVSGAVTWSQGILDLFGMRPEDYDGSYASLVARVHPDDRHLITEAVNALRVGRVPGPLHYRVIRRDGSTRLIRSVGDLFEDAAGNPLSIHGIAQDVTDLELANRALRESEERFRTLCENGLDSVALVVDGRIEYANPQWMEIIGYSPEEVRGRSPVEFVVPEDRDRVAERMRALAQGAPEHTSQYRLLRKDGEVSTVEVASRVVECGGRPAVLALVRNISMHCIETDRLLGTLTAARTALEEAARFLPFRSTADMQASKALASIYNVLRSADP